MVGIRSKVWHRLRSVTLAILVISAVISPSTITSAHALTVSLNSASSNDSYAVTDWHAIAVETLATSPRPGPVMFLDMAVVQVAVHDAVQAIDLQYEPYHMSIPGASGSPAAAASKAAHDVLVSIVPGQAASLDALYHNYFVAHGLSETDPGVSVGATAAAGILALRANDGRVPNPLPPPFVGSTELGAWRPTPSLQPGPPPSDAPMAAPWLGSVTPFTLKSGDQYRAKAPPPLSSKRYARDYAEVKALGARFNSARTPEQDQLSYFYAGNLFIQNNRVLRDIAAQHTDNIGDNARLLALGSLSIADSMITAWDNKTAYNFWRPITAIREGDNDGNSETAGDPAWEPLLNNPNYPEYTSGANNVIGAVTRSAQLFFGTDEKTFTVYSQHPMAVPNTRTYHRFSDLAQNMVDVRIYQGLHFRAADEEGRQQGRHVAQWVFGHYLRPLDD